MYDGMAKIKLYADSSCLNELPRAYNGNYVFSTSVVTGNSDINYNRNIYVKNVGTHKAYNITLTQLTGDKVISFIIPKTELLPNRTMTCKLSSKFVKGEKFSGSLQIKVDYDNLP